MNEKEAILSFWYLLLWRTFVRTSFTTPSLSHKRKASTSAGREAGSSVTSRRTRRVKTSISSTSPPLETPTTKSTARNRQEASTSGAVPHNNSVPASGVPKTRSAQTPASVTVTVTVTETASETEDTHKEASLSATRDILRVTDMDSDDDYTSDVSSQDFLQGSDDESVLDDFDDYDAGNDGSFYDREIIKPQKKPFEVDHRALSPDEIAQEQNVQIHEISLILGLPPESCAILLRHMHWNKEKMMERYMEDSEELLDAAGLDTLATKCEIEIVPATCEICYNDELGMETYAMRCGHRFCVDCYRHYLGQKIREEGEAAHIQCPQENCKRIVDSKTLELLVSDDLKE
ncbi:hypothetical protein KEM54_000129, partial [Ascosphaera aggregata]